MVDYEIFELGDFVLQGGKTLRNARLAYKTFGTLNAARDNAIVYPTWYSGQHTENEWLIGPGKALDPDTYFIIVPNLFGNGLSSSPSNTPPPWNGPRFPNVTAYDNVTAQHRLVTEHFGIDTLVLVTGWSMGALQTYHWGALYPDMVPRILPFQGSAKCSRHNFVFLEGAKAALQADAAYAEGWYTSPPNRGLRAFGRVYAGWGLSQTFYRIEADRTHMGYASLEDFLVGFWEGLFYTRDANDLLAMLWTWQNGDISANDRFNGDLDAALGAIRADAILMPASTDLYFPPEDNAIEAAAMPNADLRVLDTWWGHFAGGPGTSPDDIATLDAALKELLAR
ncbi:alpha/beta fold hydrolase [Methylobacterium sp. Leaf88]|uniref:alpha/beta fold hydrolase n=1 Tax=Methylobacterium sp. Leaf88 TaxID=1736244 RepID=UPI0006FA7EFE|nr:alpha/beta fold hydrolase [Methylobacterium sp. Leaf88]KQO71877.1 hypothetical protein ASF20_16810 [Methylobacterium sp. Leaf88]